MRSVGRVSVVAVAAVLAGWAAAPASHAQEDPPQTVTVTPTTVRDGDVVRITGTGCRRGGSIQGLVVRLQVPLLLPPTPIHIPGGLDAYVGPAEDGSFSYSFTVDTREALTGPVEDFTVELTTECLINSSGTPSVGSYPPVAITYDGTADDPPATTATTAAPAAPAPQPTAPPPAEAVDAVAGYTG